jgi:glutamate/tyrosine decarboxylase-like PLP-dependent enzyme
MRKTLPTKGTPKEEILAELREMKSGDADWRGGRSPMYIFKATDELSDVGQAAFMEFFTENALGGRRAFHSVKRMEDEVVAMALSLFHAPDEAQGFMTTGGTESIIQAVQTCRDWNRKARADSAHRGNIVVAQSAHPAFNKAARLMDLEVRRCPVGTDLRADVAGLEAAIDDDTIMLVGSAPSFPYGCIDPISEIGELARRRDIWLHVDACVGGYLAPFAKQIGRDIPDFDFVVAGVTSISADLHKFGFCPKPASTVFYRNQEIAAFHPFEFTDWPNGRFLTDTIVGTRPAGGIAGAWATFHFLGMEGYLEIARNLMAFIDSYREGLGNIQDVQVLGNPHLSIVAYGSDEVDIFRVAELMAEKGWIPGLVQKPKGIHRMMSMIQAASSHEYLADLGVAVERVREARGAGKTARISATY